MASLAQIVVTTTVSCLVSAMVAACVATVKAQGRKASERAEREREASEALKAGMRALLWAELQRIHERAMAQGGLTVEERRHLESVYAAYHGLGGNGTGTRLYEDAMRQPVLD